MDQILEVLWDSFHSFYTFGVQKCKIQRFSGKNILGCFFFKLKCKYLQTGPRDLNGTNHLTFDIDRFLFILKTWKKCTFGDF